MPLRFQCSRLPLSAISQTCDLKSSSSTHPSTRPCHLSPGPSPISSMASRSHLLPSSTCHPVNFLSHRGQTVPRLASPPAVPPTAWPSEPFYHFLHPPHVHWSHFPCHLMSVSLYCCTSLSQEALRGRANFYSQEKSQLKSVSSLSLSGRPEVPSPNPQLKALRVSSIVPIRDSFVWG